MSDGTQSPLIRSTTDRMTQTSPGILVCESFFLINFFYSNFLGENLGCWGNPKPTRMEGGTQSPLIRSTTDSMTQASPGILVSLSLSFSVNCWCLPNPKIFSKSKNQIITKTEWYKWDICLSDARLFTQRIAFLYLFLLLCIDSLRNRGKRRESTTLSGVVCSHFLANSDDLTTSVEWITGTEQGGLCSTRHPSRLRVPPAPQILSKKFGVKKK